MRIIYAYKWPLACIIAGLIFRVVGSMMKIMHWLNADNLLFAGTVLLVVGLLWLLIRIVRLRESK